jgi:cupin 2 domain-containing protein
MEIRRLLDLTDLPPQGESVQVLAAEAGVRIERILSAPGSRSGPYDQSWDEWVALLQGRAVLEVAGERVALTAGEALLLPAHRVHRVLDTSSTPPCVWLAVHIADRSCNNIPTAC